MATIGICDLISGHALLGGTDSLVTAVGDLSESELKMVMGGGSKSSGGGSTVIVNNLAYGFPSSGAIFGPVTNIVAGGDD
jgi:hypothetical protein